MITTTTTAALQCRAAVIKNPTPENGEAGVAASGACVKSTNATRATNEREEAQHDWLNTQPFGIAETLSDEHTSKGELVLRAFPP